LPFHPVVDPRRGAVEGGPVLKNKKGRNKKQKFLKKITFKKKSILPKFLELMTFLPF